MESVKKLFWDSEFFDISVGEIVSEKFNEADSEVTSFDLIYLIEKEGLEKSQIDGFEMNYQGTKVLFEKSIKDVHQEANNEILSFESAPININELYDLAFESGKFSRFKLDKKFPVGAFERLYKKWVDNSINKEFADDILMYIIDDKNAGFISYAIKNNLANVGLFAVDPNFQGKGIGSLLLKELESRLSVKGIEKIIIPTQMENTMACSFYKKNGYEIISITSIKHFWKK